MDELEAGRYRLLERIGSGGMAEVWRALDERTGDEVALKRLHAKALPDPAARERFAREIEAIRAIDHPLAVRVLDADVDEGDARLVMELLPGGSLRDRLARGPIGQAEAARVGADVASVLAAAHAAGVVHRDVTPANILFDGRSRARLVDFGVASVPLDWGRDAVTATTDVVGTLRFIAPEVLEGGVATSAADLWGLGAVLWEAVAGEPPFAAGSPAALLEARRHPAPTMPGDPVLASLVAAMLAREPADRPTASVAATGLQRIAANLEADDGEVTVVMTAPGGDPADVAAAGLAAPIAWRAPRDEPAMDAAPLETAPAEAVVPVAASPASSPIEGWAPVTPATSPAPPPSTPSSSTSRARVLAGAAIVGLAILAVALVGNPGPTARPAGAEASPAPATASPGPTEPPADDVAGPNANEPPGNGNGRGNGNNGNGNNGNGNGNKPDKPKPKGD